MRILSAELLKLRTTRPPYLLLGISALLSGLVAVGIAASGSADEGDDRALEFAFGASFFTVLATIVGILIVTNEYRHGTVMTTFLVEPHRVRVLRAKLAAALVTGLAFGLLSVAVTAAVALPWLAARGHSLELDGQALEAVGRILLVFALSCALGAAVGAIIQNQVGTIVAVLVWFLVIESIITVLSGLLFTEIGEPDPVTPYLPGTALGGIVGGEGSEFAHRGGWSALLAVGYVVGLSILGALSMTRRDP